MNKRKYKVFKILLLMLFVCRCLPVYAGSVESTDRQRTLNERVREIVETLRVKGQEAQQKMRDFAQRIRQSKLDSRQRARDLKDQQRRQKAQRESLSEKGTDNFERKAQRIDLNRRSDEARVKTREIKDKADRQSAASRQAMDEARARNREQSRAMRERLKNMR